MDALFVDMMLKGEMRAGIEFAKRAIELKPDLKVLYSTGLTVTDQNDRPRLTLDIKVL